MGTGSGGIQTHNLLGDVRTSRLARPSVHWQMVRIAFSFVNLGVYFANDMTVLRELTGSADSFIAFSFARAL